MRRKKINLKAIVCALMSSAMILTLVTPASAATARATTMKLEKTEGTVTLKTQNGSTRKITKGMRLYNGNTLSTAKYSYAHISLDSTKAVKLDQSSSATLRQSGKQLELLVKSGKLFFNVSKKLSAKESMNVRTSTMVTGVRGTCGVVEIVSSKQSKLYLIEGQVTLGTGSNATVVQGGQVATVILQDKPATTDPGKPDKGDQNVIAVEKLSEKNIPPVALQEIVADPVLQEKIEKTTELKIEKIEEAFEQFQKEEAERIEQEKAEQEKDEEKEEEKETDEKKEDESTSSSGDGSYTPGTPAPTSATLYGTVSAAAINAALKSYSKVTVAASGTDTGDAAENTTTITLEDNVTIPQNKVLIIETGEVSGSGQISVGSGTLIDTVGKASDAISDSSARLCTVNDTSVYASGLNAQVADYLNQLAKSGAITAAFRGATTVSSSISLSGSSNQLTLDMSSNMLKIESGTLTLASNVSITSSSPDATVLLSGGNLVLQGTSTNANTAIENKGGGTAIKRTAGTLTWNDAGLSVVNTSGVALPITDAIVDASGGTVTLPSSWVSVKSGCVPIWDSIGGKITLKSVKSEFTSGTVTAAELNQALSVHETVTVGEATTISLTDGNTVTVPDEKKLVINSKSFGISASSSLVIGNGATVTVNGMINGATDSEQNTSIFGTITVNDGGTIKVGENGFVMATKLELKGATLDNSGTVDVGTILTSGSEIIQNSALIKTKEYSHPEGTSTKGRYRGFSGSVLVNNSDLSGLLNEVSLLAYAATEKDAEGLQFFYSDSLGSIMADRINTIKKLSGVEALRNADEVWWHFEKDALVPSGTNITLTDFHANMGAHKFQVQGTLTLTGTVSISGEGSQTSDGSNQYAVIYLTGSGILNFDEKVSGTISNISESENYYVIAADMTVQNAKERLNWLSASLSIKPGIQQVKYTIQGVNTSDTNEITVPLYLKLPDNVTLQFRDGTLGFPIEV